MGILESCVLWTEDMGLLAPEKPRIKSVWGTPQSGYSSLPTEDQLSEAFLKKVRVLFEKHKVSDEQGQLLVSHVLARAGNARRRMWVSAAGE